VERTRSRSIFKRGRKRQRGKRAKKTRSGETHKGKPLSSKKKEHPKKKKKSMKIHRRRQRHQTKKKEKRRRKRKKKEGDGGEGGGGGVQEGRISEPVREKGGEGEKKKERVFVQQWFEKGRKEHKSTQGGLDVSIRLLGERKHQETQGGDRRRFQELAEEKEGNKGKIRSSIELEMPPKEEGKGGGKSVNTSRPGEADEIEKEKKGFGGGEDREFLKESRGGEKHGQNGKKGKKGLPKEKGGVRKSEEREKKFVLRRGAPPRQRKEWSVQGSFLPLEGGKRWIPWKF